MEVNVSKLLQESAQGQDYRAQREKTKPLVTKWAKTGLLEGIENDTERHGMAILLENQAKQLLKETSQTGTTSGNEEWNGVALPLVRRVFSEIASKDFVSVQPMNLPSGLVFYLEFKYGTAQPGFQTGKGNNDQTDSVFGITKTAGVDASQGLYGAGRFGYSINSVSSSKLTLASAASSTHVATSSITDASFNFDSVFSASIADATKLKVVTVSTASLVGNPAGTSFDPEGVRAFKISGSAINAYYPQFTSYNLTNATVTFLVSASKNVLLNSVITYQNQPTSTTRGDFEAGGSSEKNNQISTPEINIQMYSIPIVAKTRKLKAVWTPEFSQDLNAYHSIDAEAELTSMLSEYISQEIDLEILDMLIGDAATTDYWSSKIGVNYNPASKTFVNDANAAALAYNQGTWYQTLGTKIQYVSNKIHQKTMRGGANFIVCSPNVATIIESIPGYAADTNGGTWGLQSFAFGVQKVGMLNSRFQVYKNPYMLENTLLMGYRGSQFLETGAVFAPYIPLIMTPLVYDPTDFTPRKGVMTRYAKRMLRPEFFGKIYVHGLDSL